MLATTPTTCLTVNDYIWGGIGNDTYNGGDGFDTLSFERTQWSEGQAATQGINVNLVSNTVIDVFGDTDTLNSIEMVVGSIYRDYFWAMQTARFFRWARRRQF